MATVSLDDLAQKQHSCDMCGRDTTRVFDGTLCAVCHLAYLQSRDASLRSAYRTLCAVVEDLVLHEGLHPDDALHAVQAALEGARGAGINFALIDDVGRDLDEMVKAMRAEVA